MHNLSDLNIITFQKRDSPEASLFIYQGSDRVPFEIKRLFVVKSSESCERGYHAHKECTQLLIPLNGSCEVICDDGEEKKTYILDKPHEGLLVPPTIWAEQKYAKDSILAVLTDQPYDELDYIRIYDAFLEFRKST